MCAAFGLPVQTPCVRLPRTAPLRGPAVPGVHAPEIRVLKLQNRINDLGDRFPSLLLTKGIWSMFDSEQVMNMSSGVASALRGGGSMWSEW